MKIGIDIDEVLCETIDFVLKFHEYHIASRPIKRSDFSNYYIKKLPGFEDLETEMTIAFFTDALNSDRMFSELLPVKGAFEVLKKAKEAGHQLYAITARGDLVKPTTLKWINQYYPNIFEEVIFCNYHQEGKITKEEVCKQLGISFFVEDNLEFAQELGKQGIKAFLLDKPRNQAYNPERDSSIYKVKDRSMIHFNGEAKNTFYLTTAIAYMNGAPHAGHALEIIQADALARMWRLMGKEVIFQTGSDDHGMKNWNTAKKEGLEIRDFIEKNSQLFLALYKSLDVSYDEFIHTSDEKKHYPGAQLLWQKLEKAGDLYKKSYRGLYCEGCEAIKMEKDLVDGFCPDHPGKALQEIQEENYFFRLSKYKDKIKNLISSGEYRIEPEIRRNEILAFLDKAEDVSFSRQKSKMPWGIPVPGDEEHVMYVWCDALTNYLTGQGYGRNEQRKQARPADIHVIGKDILRFHAAFWPAMLLSADLPLPKTLLAHGHLTLNGEKMSKSTGNVIDPCEIVAQYGRDPFVFNLLYDVALSSDGDFSLQRLENVHNSMLIGAWGNLVNRVTNLCKKYGITRGIAHKNYLETWNQQHPDLNFEAFLTKIPEKYLMTFDLQSYLQDWYKLVQAANELITQVEPWKKYKEESTRQEALQVLEFLLYILKNLTILSAPILTQGFSKLQTILGIKELYAIDTSKNLDFSRVEQAFNLQEFAVELQPEILYQRIEN